MSEDFFAPPAFRPDDALVQLKRSLRDLRSLTERGNGFELKGLPVIALDAQDTRVEARLARRPSRSSVEWDRFALASAADVRRFIDEVKRRMTRWTEDDR